MDFVNKLTGGDSKDNQPSEPKQESGGFMDKVNNFAGGGEQGEKNEDGLDKGTSLFFPSQSSPCPSPSPGPFALLPTPTTPSRNSYSHPTAVDFVQEKVLGQGDQSNESAAEQAKDEAISDFVRDKYKSTTGKEFFIEDKDKKYGA